MIKEILFTVLNIMFGSLIVMAAVIGVQREGERMDIQRLDNCKNYGYAINKSMGRDVCAPTTHG